MRSAVALVAVCALFAAHGCGPHLAPGDAELFPEPPVDAITFWGHACSYIDVGGFGIVTDPVFEKRTIFRCRKIPAPPPAAYRNARVVLISHAHPDHLSPQTLETFPADAVILCPEPSARHVDDLGMEVRVMRPGDMYEIPGGRIIAVAVKHSGGRYSLRTGTDGRALGYVIESAREKIFYTGDTDPFDGLGDVGLIYNPDVLLINVNGHLHSADAVWAAQASHARTVVPMHFGAYGYFFLGRSRLPRDSEDLEVVPGYTVLEPGQSLPLGPASASPLMIEPLP